MAETIESPRSVPIARIVQKIPWVSINLSGDEDQHIFGRFLIDAHDPARMAKVCELKRKPEPVGGTAPLTDQGNRMQGFMRR
jgi:hypothetical protein